MYILARFGVRPHLPPIGADAHQRITHQGRLVGIAESKDILVVNYLLGFLFNLVAANRGVLICSC